jgi:hypothetical protein
MRSHALSAPTSGLAHRQDGELVEKHLVATGLEGDLAFD